MTGVATVGHINYDGYLLSSYNNYVKPSKMPMLQLVIYKQI